MKRIPELDIAKGIAIMGVMMVHLASEYQIITYGIAFHIVVFFAVTGILEKDGISLKHNIQKKARSFLYPYCTMSFLYIVVYSLGHVFTKHEIPINSIIRNCYLTLSGSGIGTLWFLPTAFVGAVIYAAVKSYFKDRAPYIILTLMVLCIIVGKVLCGVGIFGSIHYSISGIFTNELQLLFKGCIAAGFMQSGRWIWQGINFLKTRINTTSFCLSGGGCMVLYLIAYSLYKGNDLHYVKITSWVGFLAGTILGIAAVFFASIVIAKIPAISALLQYFGRNSLVVMTTHLEYKIVRIVPMLVVQLGLGVLLQNTFIFVLLCLLEMLICEMVNRTALKHIFYLQGRK